MPLPSPCVCTVQLQLPTQAQDGSDGMLMAVAVLTAKRVMFADASTCIPTTNVPLRKIERVELEDGNTLVLHQRPSSSRVRRAMKTRPQIRLQCEPAIVAQTLQQKLDFHVQAARRRQMLHPCLNLS